MDSSMTTLHRATDEELNAAVALARGWTKCDCGDPACPYWVDTNGSDWYNDVCTDPAAWGALFEELATQKRTPRIRQTLKGDFEAVVDYEKPFIDENGYVEEYAVGYAPAVGRALALAFLTSKV
jgi:hypothetical protein